MKKVAKSNILLDRLHKGVVLTCIGITLYGVGHLGLRWYRYFTVLRPEAKQRELLDQQKLLTEGSSNIDLLTDSAKTIAP
ncbi:uncharacterized protein [Atheta coriaria]|uniref:uncharacterized protein n=1 Tax=Dalotia coriaria TaxID=877792 RepID=UPI0031F35B25